METCKCCKKPINDLDTIWVIDGCFYCSRECGVDALCENYNVVADGREPAEEYFDAYAEEITPADAGLKGETNE